MMAEAAAATKVTTITINADNIRITDEHQQTTAMTPALLFALDFLQAA